MIQKLAGWVESRAVARLRKELDVLPCPCTYCVMDEDFNRWGW